MPIILLKQLLPAGLLTIILATSLSLAGTAGLGAAEKGVFDHPVTKDTRPAMLQAAKRIAANPVVVGSFTQTKRILRLKKDFVSTGDFIFSGQEGVYWNVKKPFPSTVIMGADKLVQKTADGRASVMDAQGNAVFKRFADIIQAVFAGRLEAIEADFDLFYQAEGSGWRLGMVPREAAVRKVIAAMEIQGERSIASFRLTEATGDTVVYQFADQRYPAALDEAGKALFRY